MARKQDTKRADGSKRLKKGSCTENPEGVDFEKLSSRTMDLVPLKIDSRTTIMVRPERCNEAYRQEYINRPIEAERKRREQAVQRKEKQFTD